MATIASGGVHHTPYVVQKVVVPDGKVLSTPRTPATRCSTPDVAALRAERAPGRRHRRYRDRRRRRRPGDLRQDRHHRRRPPTRGSSAPTPRRGQQLATAVWFGNHARTCGGAGFGGDSAAPVFQTFMSQALAEPARQPRCPTRGRCAARRASSVIDTGGRTDNSGPWCRHPAAADGPATAHDARTHRPPGPRRRPPCRPRRRPTRAPETRNGAQGR